VAPHRELIAHNKEIKLMMHVLLKAALALVFVASLPLNLKAAPQRSSGEPLTAKEVRKAEKEARTAADHARLAAYYQSKAQRLQTKLAEAEDLVDYWGRKSEMVNRQKIPNPYFSAKNLAGSYREELERTTKLAADHRKMADSLQAGQ